MNLKVGLVAASVATAFVACSGPKTETKAVQSQDQTTVSKSVVVFYSQNGTTKKVAEEFQKQLDADAVELRMTVPYPSTYDSTIAAARAERESKTWPALENSRLNLDKYDTIYLGYPIMFGTFAPPIYTFLDSNDLGGKVVVPFCTYGSGGRKASSAELKTLEPNADVTLSFGISNKRVNNTDVNVADEVATFLGALTSGKTEEMLCGGFSEQRPVNDEDLAVFAEATKDYGYLNLKPMSVATQVVAGMNYLFTCEMQAFGGALETVSVKIFKPLPGQGDPQMIGVEK